ncbi:sensor histidine kinase [Microbacterium halophytorum]|uniref:sensor histidine kinase n=1 Tax=Microbacterium halophytorum TaxID=2067568 RepID=UPI000CFD2862|nr:histidine kinase [Microbacterium halophytorum]
MSTSSSPANSRRLARGVTATWWYTASAVLGFEGVIAFFWFFPHLTGSADVGQVVLLRVASIVWVGSTWVLLSAYRSREPLRWATLIAMLCVAAVYGIVAFNVTGSFAMLAAPLGQALVLLRWPRGIRLRVALAVTAVLVCLLILDIRSTLGPDNPGWVPVAYAALLPAMSVTSLWWWDVLDSLDRARASEARLAATQERLRVATDVHDLQGHHLQVIALQLELADRLIGSDPDAAAEHVRAARASVDEARQGTRDLATRVRSVPLPDEIANAADLLAAAGLSVTTEVAPDADRAPASVLGPVIRETTTNVLKHGTGGSASLRLVRDGGAWCYEIANTAAGDAAPAADASGLAGLERRVAEAGGTFEARHDESEFVATARVPLTKAGAR